MRRGFFDDETTCISSERCSWPSWVAAKRTPTRGSAPCWWPAAEVVGEGYHRGPGTPHAEVVALEQAGARARGATLFVTLEPCCQLRPHRALHRAHHRRGRLPRSGRRPRSQSGRRRPRSGGACAPPASRWSSTTATCTGVCLALNEPFARFIREGLPLITFKAAVSLDGKVAAAGGDARWISSTESRRLAHDLRAAADAVMVGAGTVRRDDPRLTARDAAGPDPVRVVVSRGARLPLEALVFTTAREVPTILLATGDIAPEAAGALEGHGVEVVRARDLRDGLAVLAARGLLEILLEGGPTLAGALLADELIDRLTVFVAPLVLGRGAPDLVALAAPTAVAEGLALADVSWETTGRDAVCRARVVRSAPRPRRRKRSPNGDPGRCPPRAGPRATTDVHRRRRGGRPPARPRRGGAQQLCSKSRPRRCSKARVWATRSPRAERV